MTSPISSADPKLARSGNLKLIMLALGGLISGLALGWLIVSFLQGDLRPGATEFNGIVMQSPAPMGDFSLTAQGNRQVQLSDFRGQLVLLYFGYTYCPDVCPTTMNTLASALEKLRPGDRDQVQVLMVSVDPKRDTPDALADYLAHFDPTFLGLTGTPEEIAAAAELFGIYYQRGEGTVASGYLIDHTATVAVLDEAGYLRLIFPFETPAKEITSDLRRLIKE